MAQGPAGADGLLAALGAELAERLPAAVPAWARVAVARVLDAWRAAGGELGPATGGVDAVLERAEHASRSAAAVLAEQLRGLSATGVDAQRATPLQLVRRAVVPGLTAVLAESGVPPVARDRFQEERFPDDPYGLVPGSVGALDPELAGLAAAWGAAKAAAHRASPSRP